MPSFTEIVKKAREVQERMARLQEEMASHTVEATSGGGMVRVVANCKMEVREVHIEKEVVDPNDVEMLQDLIVAATNEALRKAHQTIAEEMSKITGGISIPGLF